MTPKKSTAYASAPANKTTKKQATKKTTTSKPSVEKAAPKKAAAKKPKVKSASKDNVAIANPSIEAINKEVVEDADESSGVAATFHYFKKLPLELRLRIWGYAAPEPTTIIQRVSEKSINRYTYRREPPAVLHACRESRLEYLDIDEGTESASVARRRKEHPVYKLFSFRADRMQCTLAYFSLDIDAFYGQNYIGKTSRYAPRWSMQRYVGGISELDIAGTLKHLVLADESTNYSAMGEYFRNGFPKLESLTIIFPKSRPTAYPSPDYIPITIAMVPESRGQIDLNALGPIHRRFFDDTKSYLEYCFFKEKALFPEWTPPVVKMRLEMQFARNAHYTR